MIKVNNTELYYSVQGEGHPLLLLHGNGEDHTIFNTLIKQLKQHYKVYAIDSRNHGKSQQTDDYSYQTMACDIYEFIKSLNLKNPYVLGFSDGAIIALLLQLAHPNTFSKMAWLGINLKPTDFKPEILKKINEAYEESKDPLLKLMLQEPDIELISLSTISTPTLVIKAENEIFKEELYHSITKTMPDAKLLEMKDHQHDTYIVDNDILLTDLINFFNI